MKASLNGSTKYIFPIEKHLNMDDTSTYEIASTSDGEYVLRRVMF